MLQDSVTTYETTSICDEKLINQKNQNTFTNSTFGQEICTVSKFFNSEINTSTYN